MPPIRHHEQDDIDCDQVVLQDIEDDDMPPLVDQPSTSSSPPLTYTFFTDMTPMSFSSASNTPTTSTSTPNTVTGSDFSTGTVDFASTPTDTYTPPLPVPNPRGSHGRRRDASYIPRPPNAFILFRSSFIRSQQVTGKVEGNHSNLSKIIGMYWKTLPQAERDEWEAKAVSAQAEHRRRYPDWRFRPGANALAKLKVKDGGGPSTQRQRRIQATKDPPDKGGGGTMEFELEEDDGNGKGKGKARARGGIRARGRGRAGRRKEFDGETEERDKGRDKGKAKEERRFAKIADLLMEGKKGLELEQAIREWETERKSAKDKLRLEKQKEKQQTALQDDRAGSSNRDESFDMTSTMPGPSSFATSQPESIIPSNIRSPPLSLTPASPMDETDQEMAPVPLGRQNPNNDRRSSSPSPERPSHLDLPSSFHDAHRMPSSQYQGPVTQQPQPQSPSQQERLAGLTQSAIPLTHMFKRSLSAPAPRHRYAYPRRFPPPSSADSDPSSGLQGEQRLRRPSMSLAAVSAGPSSTATTSSMDMFVDDARDGGDNSRQEETATAISSVMYTSVQRRGGGAGFRSPVSVYHSPPLGMQSQYYPQPHSQSHGHVRRDTVSLPLDSTRFSFIQPMTPSQLQSHHHHHQQQQQQQQHRGQEQPYFQHQIQHVQQQEGQPHRQRPLTWQEEEERRRYEVETGYGYWWHDDPGTDVEGGDAEPVRDGSFETVVEADTGEGVVLGYPTVGQYPEGYTMEHISPAPPPPNDGSQAIRWTREDGRVGLVALDTGTEGGQFIGHPRFHFDRNRSGSGSVSTTSSPISASPLPAQSAPALVTAITTTMAAESTSSSSPNSGTGGGGGGGAGSGTGFFFPPAPPTSSLSPVTPISSFSSLAGWDGESHSSLHPSGSPRTSSIPGMGRKPAPWYDGAGSGWDAVQPLGLEGGKGEWSDGGGDSGKGMMNVDAEDGGVGAGG